METNREHLEAYNKPNFADLVMTAQDYAMEADHERPYVYELSAQDKKICYIGFSHSSNPEDPNFKIIQDKIENGNFDLVVIEGAKGVNAASLEDQKKWAEGISEEEAISRHGENIYTAKLAIDKNLKVVSPEPTNLDQANYALANGATKEAIFADTIAIVIAQYHRLENKPEFEEYIKECCNQMKSDLGWNDFEFSLDNYKQLHKKFTGQEFNLEDEELIKSLADPIPWPGKEYTDVNKAGTLRNKYRDEYMVKQIEEYLKNYKNILIVFGSSHAVMQEPALRKMMEYENSK